MIVDKRFNLKHLHEVRNKRDKINPLAKLTTIGGLNSRMNLKSQWCVYLHNVDLLDLTHAFDARGIKSFPYALVE